MTLEKRAGMDTFGKWNVYDPNAKKYHLLIAEMIELADAVNIVGRANFKSTVEVLLQ